MSIQIFKHDHPRRLRVATIGAGSHALRNVYPCFPFLAVDLVAVCDRDPQRAASAADSFGAPKVYADHREMLQHEHPDAVIVVLNYGADGRPLYPPIAIDAMRAGAHVWIEKPPAASSDEIREMIAVGEETGKHVGVGFKKMFASGNVKAKEILSSPEFGRTTTLTARYPQSLPPEEERSETKRMSGFLDHIVHPYSMLRLLGGDIDAIRVERQASGGSLTAIRFRNGTLGSLHLPAAYPGYAPLERTEVVGEGGMIVVDNNLRVTYYRPGHPPGGYGQATSFFGPNEQAPLVWEPEFSLGQLYNKGLAMLGYLPELADFVDRTLAEQALEKGNLTDALEILKVYEAYLRPSGDWTELERER